MAQISTVSIPCLVVQMNNKVFATPDGIIGRVEQVPCRAVLIDSVPFWASPVKNFGIYDPTALQYRVDLSPNDSAPTYDSFLVQRVRDKISGYTWWIYITEAEGNQFINSCATCCGADAVAMPGINGIDIVIAPCQNICAQNAEGKYEAVFGLPTLTADNPSYHPIGSFDNVELATALNYDNVADLLTFLNANWNPLGNSSPNFAVTWTASDDELSLIATFDNALIVDHELCVNVSAVPAT